MGQAISIELKVGAVRVDIAESSDDALYLLQTYGLISYCGVGVHFTNKEFVLLQLLVLRRTWS